MHHAAACQKFHESVVLNNITAAVWVTSSVVVFHSTLSDTTLAPDLELNPCKHMPGIVLVFKVWCNSVQQVHANNIVYINCVWEQHEWRTVELLDVLCLYLIWLIKQIKNKLACVYSWKHMTIEIILFFSQNVTRNEVN